MKYFSSDWHLGHNTILRHRPEFSSVEEMRDAVHDLIFNLHRGDELYFLGDLAWTIDAYRDFFDFLPKGIKFFWILGNHDRKRWKQFVGRATSISPMLETKVADHPVVLCHYPMITWNRSHYNAWQLFGHHHRNSIGSDKVVSRTLGKQLNVNWELHDYRLWSEDELENYMESRPDNWDCVELQESKTS